MRLKYWDFSRFRVFWLNSRVRIRSFCAFHLRKSVSNFGSPCGPLSARYAAGKLPPATDEMTSTSSSRVRFAFGTAAGPSSLITPYEKAADLVPPPDNIRTMKSSSELRSVAGAFVKRYPWVDGSFRRGVG